MSGTPLPAACKGGVCLVPSSKIILWVGVPPRPSYVVIPWAEPPVHRLELPCESLSWVHPWCGAWHGTGVEPL